MILALIKNLTTFRNGRNQYQRQSIVLAGGAQIN